MLIWLQVCQEEMTEFHEWKLIWLIVHDYAWITLFISIWMSIIQKKYDHMVSPLLLQDSSIF